MNTVYMNIMYMLYLTYVLPQFKLFLDIYIPTLLNYYWYVFLYSLYRHIK